MRWIGEPGDGWKFYFFLVCSQKQFYGSNRKQGMENYICSDLLRQRITDNLNDFKVCLQKENGYKKAAVALAVVDIAGDPGVNGIKLDRLPKETAAVVLTRRSFALKNHTGQWALPGGSIESGETTEAAALRELNEEVGLDPGRAQIIGRLDDFVTRSGFVISPIVVWGGNNVELVPNPSEVSSIHRIPITEFMRKDAPLLDRIPRSEHPVLRMPVGNSYIASPTGALLYQFREVAILGQDTRVAHFEQPYFAWQ